MNRIGTGLDVFRFSIEGRLTAAMVGELAEAILPAIASSQAVEVDLSQVSEIDLAGLRLMLDAKLDAIGMGKELCFTRHSKPVVEMLCRCGVEKFLGVSG